MEQLDKGQKKGKFEESLKDYLKKGRTKLENDLEGTRHAIKLISLEKTREFMRNMDKGLNIEEKKYLAELIVQSMYQSFCFGYGIGKLESDTKSNIML